MDVIDLCDDDETTNEPKSKTQKIAVITKLKANSMQKKSLEPKQPPRVAPIRVVNLASIQDIRVVNKEKESKHNRRKSAHQIRRNTDDSIEFITEAPKPSTITQHSTEINSDSNSSSTHTSSSSFLKNPLPVRKPSIKRNKLLGRPNEELMRRVAFLRVCTEYMLKELRINNVVFGENQSLQMLKAQYAQAKQKTKIL